MDPAAACEVRSVHQVGEGGARARAARQTCAVRGAERKRSGGPSFSASARGGVAAAGGGAMPCDPCGQHGQWSWCPARGPPESGLGALWLASSSWTHREPWAVHTSTQPADPETNASACDITGANAANAMASVASQSVKRR